MMKRSTRLCQIGLPALVVILALISPTVVAEPGMRLPAARMNEAQVVQLARAFCQNLGQSIPAHAFGTATFTADAQGPPSHYWQPIWSVSFPGKAEVEVVDANGVVARYENEAYSIIHQGKTPAGDALPQQEAILRAKEALDATGQKEPLLFWQASLDHYSDPPLAETTIWMVRWHRAAGGVMYREQHASLALDAQTGEVKYLVLMFGTAPLASAVKVVNQQDAVNIAASLIINQGIEQEATHSGTALEIVAPEYDWTERHGRQGPANAVRLAWVSTFVVDGHWRQVYTDTETGEILGGGRDNGPAGMRAATVSIAAPPPVAPMLRSLRAVYVRGRGADGKWAAKPLLKFGAKDQPLEVAALMKTTDFRKQGPSGAAPQQIVLASKSNALGVYSYFPETGLLGGGSDWAAVPDDFKTWMQHQIAQAGAAPSGPKPRR